MAVHHSTHGNIHLGYTEVMYFCVSVSLISTYKRYVVVVYDILEIVYKCIYWSNITPAAQCNNRSAHNLQSQYREQGFEAEAERRV